MGGRCKKLMQKKKIKNIIAVSSVVGTVLLSKSITANATELNQGISLASASKGQVVNVNSSLRIRESASTSSAVIGTLRNGNTFDIISKSGGWYQINYNGTKGYVHGDYVKEITSLSTSPSPSTPSQVVDQKGKVYNVSTNLRVRSGASTSSSVLGYITNNTEVSIVGSEGNWYKIKYNSGYGYVSKDYIIREFSLRDVVMKAVKNNSRDFINRNIKLNINKIEGNIFSDAKWIEFIINQIIINAIKFSIPNKGEVSISSKVNENNIVLTIKDNGVGINEKDIDRVFEKGFTGENGRNFGKSTGIGLYLCKKLCDKLGIGISLTSKEKIGTKVSIVFPKGKFNIL